MVADETRGNVVLGGVCRISLNLTSPTELEIWRGSLRTLASVSAEMSAHLNLWMLMYLRYGSVGGSGNQSASVMMTDRWSEQRVVSGCQVAPNDWCGESIVRSQGELRPLLGTLVGEASLRRARLLVLRSSTMEFQREIDWSSSV